VFPPKHCNNIPCLYIKIKTFTHPHVYETQTQTHKERQRDRDRDRDRERGRGRGAKTCREEGLLRKGKGFGDGEKGRHFSGYSFVEQSPGLEALERVIKSDCFWV
jgi:hypothetical protein